MHGLTLASGGGLGTNSINTNPAAQQDVAALDATSSQVEEAERQMATGLRVANAKDDGATWAIAQNMRSRVSAWQAVGEGLSRGRSILDVANQAAGQITDLLSQLQQKAVSYADVSLDAPSRAAIQSDMASLIGRIDQVAGGASFDGVNLLTPPTLVTDFTPPAGTISPTFTFSTPMNGNQAWWTFQGAANASASFGYQETGIAGQNPYSLPPVNVSSSSVAVSAVYAGGYDATTFAFHVGPPATSPTPANYGLQFSAVTFSQVASTMQINSDPNGGKTTIGYEPLSSSALGLGGLNWNNPLNVLATVGAALTQATNAADALGVDSNGLQNLQTQATKMEDSLQAGVGNLVDADLAKEGAKLQAAQSRQQLATKALAIANAGPQWIMSLFR